MNRINQQRAAELNSKITNAVKLNVSEYAALTKATKEKMTTLLQELRSPYEQVNAVYTEALKKAFQIKRGAESKVSEILEQERNSLPKQKTTSTIEDLFAMQVFKDKLAYTPTAQLPQLALESLTEPQVHALKAEMSRRMNSEDENSLKLLMRDSIASIKYEPADAYLESYERELAVSRINHTMPYLTGSSALNSNTIESDLGFDIVQQAYAITNSLENIDAAGSNVYFQ